MDLIDTHCHIHEADESFDGESETRIRWKREGALTPDAMLTSARKAGVNRVICVGTTVEDSVLATEFVQSRNGCWCSIGIHPHEAAIYLNNLAKLKEFNALAKKPKVVAIGECGLDFYYNHAPKNAQIEMLRLQIELALEHDLPIIFHVRDAFDDFWPIFDSYKNIRGVIHSFSSDKENLYEILQRNLFIGLNGIMTFTKNTGQLEAAKAVPLDRIVVETDAPFLTPTPYRGKICEPRHVRVTTEFLADLRGESLDAFASATTVNALNLFKLV